MSALPLPMMFVAWGTSPGYEWEYGKIAMLRDLAVDAKFKSVAVQLGYATADQVKVLKDGGLVVPAWNVLGPGSSKTLYDELGADGLIAQVEGVYQYTGALTALDEGIAQGQPRTVVTTYAGLEQGQWAELAHRGVTDCYVECYHADGFPHADLDRMLAQGVAYGIPRSALYAVCGTYGAETPAYYSGLDKLNRSYACYLGEPMTTDAWLAWGGVNMTTPVYWWVLTAGVKELHAERAKTYAPGDDGLTRMLNWADTHKDVIRAAKDVRLQHLLR